MNIYAWRSLFYMRCNDLQHKSSSNGRTSALEETTKWNFLRNDSVALPAKESYIATFAAANTG